MLNMREIITNNISETEKAAKDLAKTFKGGEILALFGRLGVGKTVFVKAMAKALNISEVITSQTFVLMKVYDVNVERIKHFIHVDCYRLEGKEDLADIGLLDYLGVPQTVSVIEWADKISNLPDKTIKISMEYLDEEKRKITIN